jgi:hypothetical protein
MVGADLVALLSRHKQRRDSAGESERPFARCPRWAVTHAMTAELAHPHETVILHVQAAVHDHGLFRAHLEAVEEIGRVPVPMGL